MEGYGVTLARYDKASDSYVTASKSVATHIAHYGEGALIHAEPLKDNKPSTFRSLVEKRFKDIKNLSFRDSKEPQSIDRSVRIASSTPVHGLTKMIERLAW